MNEQIRSQLSKAHQAVKNIEKYWLTHESNIEFTLQKLRDGLGKSFLDYSACANDINIKVCGNYKTFKSLNTILMNEGYKPDNRPSEDKFTEYSTWWSYIKDEGDTEEYPRYWVWFTSTVCKRTKTGETETVELDLYEITCGEAEAAA